MKSRIFSVTLWIMCASCASAQTHQSANDDIELSSDVVKALIAAAKHYESSANHSLRFYCTVFEEESKIVVLVRPYSAEQVKASVFASPKAQLPSGVSVEYSFDRETLTLISEQIQR